MKEVYESPDFEVIELEGEIATARTIKDSNETDILNLTYCATSNRLCENL